MTAAENKLGHPAISIVAALAIFISLWLLDFPKPGYDDLFYTGAALNMAGGGDFSNPFLARQGFPSPYFFVYPPLHSYVLAAWLSVFGVSSGSVTGFAVLMIAVTSLATTIILRRYRAGFWLELAVPFGAAFGLLDLGLRPDPMAIALTMAGFALADWRRKASIPLACGFLLMFLGASAAPRVTFFALALAACAGYQSWREAESTRAKWLTLSLAIGAIAVTALVFLCLIHFRPGEFLTTFRYHATRFTGVKDTKIHRLASFAIGKLRILHWPFLIIPLGLAIRLWRKPRNSLSNAAVCTMAVFPLAAVTGLIGLGAMWWLVLAMLFLGGAGLKFLPERQRIGLTSVIVLLLIFANRRDFICVVGALSGEISADLGEERVAASAVRPSPEHALLVDSWVARYLYNYQLPEGVLDLEFGTPFPGALPGYNPLSPEDRRPEFRPGDVYIAGPRIVSMLLVCTYLERKIQRWNPFGISAFAMEKRPRHVYLIPSESCKGRREKSS